MNPSALRIIHTSDWHLGQYFYSKSRAAEHQAFLQWLIGQVREQQADAVIVAGDVFDTGSPPSYARELYNRFVVDLQESGCQLVVLGGNHDSVAMLNESRELLAQLNTRVIASGAQGDDDPVMLLTRRDGSPGALLCAVPYLRPRDVQLSRAEQSAQEKQVALTQAIRSHYHDLYERALRRRETLDPALPIVATGHLTTLGASTSESVRDIYIGTLDAFPTDAFPPADYIALGHIHRPQAVSKTGHIRYSGSPIALSFDELGSPKSVCLVTLSPGLPAEVTLLPVPIFQPMQLIKGDLAAITRQLSAFADYQGERPVWLDIEIDSDAYLSEVQKQIQQLSETLPVEIVLLRRSKTQRRDALQRREKETLNELTVDDVFERRLAQESDEDAERLARLRTAFRQVVEEAEQQLRQPEDQHG